MTEVKRTAVLATVIGDVVGSRTTRDRAGLHERLARLLDEVNATRSPEVPLRVTVGDEFQGCFASLGEALGAVLALRVAALPDLDLRHGIGWGEVTVLADEPRVEDGPGWWAARGAIEDVKAEAVKSALRYARTAHRLAADDETPARPALAAALLLLDQQLGGLSHRSLGVLRGLIAGRSQREIAQEVGISPSAVSQRVRNDGLAVLVAAVERLEEVR